MTLFAIILSIFAGYVWGRVDGMKEIAAKFDIKDAEDQPMAKDTYKKRAKGNWNQGKGCKGDAEERQYAKTEIEKAVAHDVEDQPTRHKGKRKRNKKASLEYTIAWYTQKIAEWERLDRKGSIVNMFRDSLKEATKEYKEKYEEEK